MRGRTDKVVGALGGLGRGVGTILRNYLELSGLGQMLMLHIRIERIDVANTEGEDR